MVLGVATGPYCDASTSLEALVRGAGQSAALDLMLAAGYAKIEVAQGIATQRYRKAMAIACFRSHAEWISAVIAREDPPRPGGAKSCRFGEFRERALQYEHESFLAKRRPPHLHLAMA